MSEKTQEIITKLKAGIEELFESDKYADYLRFLSRFHNYSAGNCILINLQCPYASQVASYTDWTKMKRQVKKGAKAIKILAPHTYKDTDKEGKEHVYTGFHVASVFDVSQTYNPDGEALPAITRALDYSVHNYNILLDTLISIAPVPVDFENISSGANGYFSCDEGCIVIKQGLPEMQTLKTLLHEMSHAYLHSKGADEEMADRHTREVQAESIAYVVSNYLGMDVSEYSFGYIAGWSGDKKLSQLRASLEVIRKTSDKIISDIENTLHQKGVVAA